MKIGDNFLGIKISAAGLSVQRKKMNLISENIANTNTTKTQEGIPYQRKFLAVRASDLSFNKALGLDEEGKTKTIPLMVSDSAHFSSAPEADFTDDNSSAAPAGISMEELRDSKSGDVVYMPEHPDADGDGYVHMPNVDIVTEMVDMIAATRSYEANLTAFNSSKQMAKDSLEI